MRDSSNFRPCPNRPGHWYEVALVPEEHGQERQDRRVQVCDAAGRPIIGQYRMTTSTVDVLVREAREEPTGFELAAKPGQSLEDAILAFEAGNPDEAAEFDVVTMMMGDGSGEG